MMHPTSDNPLVSVVIPCFNAQNDISDAVQSALNQTYSRVEVIVIDDGSTDGSLDVIQSFGEQIRFKTGPNQGACSARNRGVEIANGTLIQFLDADDQLYSEKLSDQVPLVLDNPQLLVYCGGDIGKPDGSFQFHGPDIGDRDPVEFSITDWISTPAPIHFRSTFLKIGGFDASLPCSQERDLHMRLAVAGLGFRLINKPLYSTRFRSDSITRDWQRMLTRRESILHRVESELLEGNGLLPNRRRALGRFHAKDARSWLSHGEVTQAQLRLVEAQRLAPNDWLDVVYPKGWQQAMHKLIGLRAMYRLISLKNTIARKV